MKPQQNFYDTWICQDVYDDNQSKIGTVGINFINITELNENQISLFYAIKSGGKIRCYSNKCESPTDVLKHKILDLTDYGEQEEQLFQSYIKYKRKNKGLEARCLNQNFIKNAPSDVVVKTQKEYNSNKEILNQIEGFCFQCVGEIINGLGERLERVNKLIDTFDCN